MTFWTIRRATPHDWPKIAALLAMADLPLAGAEAHLSDFFLAWRDDVLIGTAGLKRYGDTALLRSVAVAPTEHGQGLGQGIGRALYISLLALLHLQGFFSVYAGMQKPRPWMAGKRH